MNLYYLFIHMLVYSNQLTSIPNIINYGQNTTKFVKILVFKGPKRAYNSFPNYCSVSPVRNLIRLAKTTQAYETKQRNKFWASLQK